MLLLLACHTIEKNEPVEVDYSSLAAPGPYPVGYHESSLSYPDPAGVGERTLRLALWYPAESATGETPAYDEAFEGIGAYTDAPPAAGPFSLLVYSHGHQAFAESSGFLMEHLASQGYIVAAPDHTDDLLTDGPRTTEIYYQRPKDISAVLDLLLGDGDFLAGHVDSGPVLALGHSFGGYTVQALAGATYDLATLGPACEAGTGPGEFCSTWSEEAAAQFAGGFRDERIVAGLAMAAGDYDLFGATGVSATSVPVFHLMGSLDDHTPSDGEFYWSSLAGGDHRRLDIEGATHVTFTDFSGTFDATTEGRIDTSLGFQIVNAYAYAWVLRAESADFGDRPAGWEAPLLDGEVQPWPEAQLSR